MMKPVTARPNATVRQRVAMAGVVLSPNMAKEQVLIIVAKAVRLKLKDSCSSLV